jgi:PilZ domain
MATFDKRRHRRSNIATAVEYVLDPLPARETFDGVIADISESGLCLLTTTPLSKGQEILIKINPSAFSQTATVRWSRQYDDLYCRAGLEFI